MIMHSFWVELSTIMTQGGLEWGKGLKKLKEKRAMKLFMLFLRGIVHVNMVMQPHTREGCKIISAPSSHGKGAIK